MRVFRYLALAILVTAIAANTAARARAGAALSMQDQKHAASGGQQHEHSDWWCAEHGVPEEVCSQCSAKVAAQCKKKGDWCKEHDRARSQCFKCEPKLKEKFAAMYRAKYGKEPPPTEDDKADKENKGK